MEDTNKGARVAVNELLAAAGVTFSAIHRGARVKDKTKENPRGWECDAWSVAFQKGDGREALEEFDYFTGTGHRQYLVPHSQPAKFRPPGWQPTVKEAGSPRTLYREQYDRNNLRAVAPQAADVLYSLLLDSSAASQSFESWASEFGYDTDSRKAEATYRACQQNADKLARVLDATTRAEPARILEDF
jgi:hypothetical protein